MHWENDIAVQWRRTTYSALPRPHHPRRALRPTGGTWRISTDVIWEHDEAGEDVAEIATAFDLDTNTMSAWALAYSKTVPASTVA